MDRSWEQYLPKPYQPLTHFNGSFETDWKSLDPDENLKNEKSHLSVELYPRSERMQYGLDLTRKLLGLIKDAASENQSSFFIFYTLDRNKTVDDVIVRKRNGLFFRTSAKQYIANQAYVNEGFTTFEIPILLENWKVSDTDGHLNCAANDQVMRDLARKLTEYLKVPRDGIVEALP